MGPSVFDQPCKRKCTRLIFNTDVNSIRLNTDQSFTFQQSYHDTIDDIDGFVIYDVEQFYLSHVLCEDR